MLVILGAGYVGRFLYAEALARGLAVRATSRTPDARLAFVLPSHRLCFDLERDATWRHIPQGADIVWCFPAQPFQAVSAFADAVIRRSGRVLVLGSTSAYDQGAIDPDSPIDESAPIDRTRPRVIGEEYLRTRYGAVILRVAGLYGPGRNVVDWIRKGKIGRSPRYVNLVHVDDVAAICLLALEHGHPGEVYNVSDGEPRRWSDICEEAQRRWGVSAWKEEDGDRRPGKRLSIEKLRQALTYRFRHPDLYRALDAIESATSSRLRAAPSE